MTKTTTLRAAFGVFAVSALLVGSGVMAGAASTPKLTITPATGLKAGETVKVSGTGFKAGDMLYIVECVAAAKGESGCNVLGATPATVSSKGTLPATTFKVTTGATGSGSCGTKASNLKCEISAGNASGGDTASAPIVFVLKK
jgi:hypothetical protein